MNKKELSLAVLKGKKTNQIPFMPITMMFAADLIGVPYKKYETEAAVQAEGQLKTAEKFGAAHVSVISDPCVEAHDFGAETGFPENAPAYINENNALISDKKTLAKLKITKPEDGLRMSNRLEAVRLLSEKSGGELLVEGWVEGPCAEASDLRGINHIMMDFYDDENFVADLMDLVTEQAIEFALAQIEAGADIIGIGDAASSLIGPQLYKKFSVPRTKRYVEAIHNAGAMVRLHICGTTESLSEYWKEINFDLIDIDYGNSMAAVRKNLGPDTSVLAGNLDPVRDVRDGTPAVIKELLEKCMQESAPGYIVGAGCEIPRDTPHENLLAMYDFAENCMSS
jgi:MtaA/CmuA family methyltransferase